MSGSGYDAVVDVDDEVRLSWPIGQAGEHPLVSQGHEHRISC